MKPGGPPNLQQLMKQAQKMQAKVEQAQQELAGRELTGTAGGGLVSVRVTGTGDVLGVTIDKRAVDPDDVESLEDLVLAALRDAGAAAQAAQAELMGPLTGGAGGLGLPGM